MSSQKALSKSNYLKGIQCPKLLWMSFNEPEKIPKADESTQYRFDEGHIVGEYAKKLYPKGINVPFDEFNASLEETKKLLERRVPLFEAGFLVNDCYSRIDVLVPVEKDSWDIIEVKSSSSVKEINLHDVAFQKCCLVESGLKMRNCYILHLNRDYIRNGDLELQKLFTKTDITEEVNNLKGDTKARIAAMFEIIKLKKCPEIRVGNYCSNPYECSLKEQCWANLPENNVYSLRGGWRKINDLVGEDIIELKDVPEQYQLNDKQRIQVKCAKTNQIHINKAKIKDFVDSLKFPLYFLDFETYARAVPLYDGLKPHQAIPFQYSLHILESWGKNPKHYSFIAINKTDSRKEFISSLKKNLGKHGDIMVFHQSFEIGRLKELAEFLPMYEPWIREILTRIVDLIMPFRSFYYYNPKQNGSASLKYVLPSVTGQNYDSLEINNGDMASREYFKIIHTDVTKEEFNQSKKNLEKYCGLDTEGMIWILNELRKLCE